MASPASSIIVTDVGSTTTKAILFEHAPDGWRMAGRGEAPTSVEAPDEDVTIGVTRAISHLEAVIGRSLLTIEADLPRVMADQYLSTSSAGGGLQMVVCGNVATLSAHSARRAALGGGAILLDVFAADDERSLFARLERLRSLRPDMILLSGGVEGAGAIGFVLEMSDFIRAANPRPKFGHSYQLPIIYAGTSSQAETVQDMLGDRFAVRIVPNLRPGLNEENLEPTREAIHDVFIEHVMAQAPGYPRLTAMATAPLMPTPVAVGEILQALARQRRTNLLCVDIGGATTDVFSVIRGQYHRTVSANLGMSYSAGNVLTSAGDDNVARWLPIDLAPGELGHRIGNKLTYPTTIPATVTDLLVEQALAREALRLSLADHRAITRVRRPATVFTDLSSQQERELFNIGSIGLIIGSGGVLSHAPERAQAAAMLIDAFAPEGVTELAVDSVFMLPHLGILARDLPEAALALLEKECLVPLGTCIAPTGHLPAGLPGLTVTGRSSTGQALNCTVRVGDLLSLPLAAGATAELTLVPVPPLNVGAGPGLPRTCHVAGGASGIIFDLRGRPFDPAALPDRRERLRTWLTRLNALPSDAGCDEEVAG